MTSVELKYAERLVKTVPEPVYENICKYLSLTNEDRNMLQLRFRRDDYARTREYVAEEIGVSPATLDRKIKCILSRICKYCLICG